MGKKSENAVNTTIHGECPGVHKDFSGLGFHHLIATAAIYS